MWNKRIRLSKDYRLRYVAGQYWLINIGQKGVPYQGPMCINSIGAEIWDKLKDGQTMEEIAECLSLEYEVSKEEIKEDVLLFCTQLKSKGALIEE